MKSRQHLLLAIAAVAAAGVAFTAPSAIAAPTPTAPTTPQVTVTPQATAAPVKPSGSGASAAPSAAAARSLSVTVQPPTSLTGAAVFVVTGAQPGAQVEIAVGRDRGVQAEAVATVRADANGRAVVRLAHGNGRWAANATYLWAVHTDAASRTGTFRTPGTGTSPATTRPPAGGTEKTTSASGGLAKTGV